MSAPTDAAREQELSPMPTPQDGDHKTAGDIPTLEMNPTPSRDVGVAAVAPAPEEPAAPKHCLVRALRYYWQPLLEFPRSFLRTLYHLLNFPWTIAMAVVVGELTAAGLACIVAACIGLLILYLTMELAMGLAWIDLGMAFHMVEGDEQRRAAGCPRLGFRRGTLPDCADLRNRAKSLVTDVQLYSALFYQILAKPVVTMLTCWVFLLVVFNVAAMFLWVWWLVDDAILSKYGCVGSLTCVDDVCTCHGWALNSGGDVVVASLEALLVLPLVLRVSNWLAECCLCAAYFFLTKVYDKETDDEQALLGPRSSAPASQPREAAMVVQV